MKLFKKSNITCPYCDNKTQVTKQGLCMWCQNKIEKKVKYYEELEPDLDLLFGDVK